MLRSFGTDAQSACGCCAEGGGIKIKERKRKIIDAGCIMPAYDYVLKCSHVFNLLDARGAISLSERTEYIGRVRNMARKCAQKYLEQRKELG